MATADVTAAPGDVLGAPAFESEATKPGTERLESEIAANLALLLPAALMVVLSVNAGGFYPGTTALAVVILLGGLAACLVLSRQPFAGLSWGGLICGGALALLAAFTLSSSSWSHAPGRALLAYDRVLVYALTFVLVASVRRTHARVRMLTYGIAAGIVVVCLAALASRTLPNVVNPGVSANPSRLGFPLTYWNTLGLLAGVGLIICGHLACSAREPRLARVLGAGAAPLLATTLFLTFSRGAIWASVVGILVYLLIARPPGALLAGLSTLPPWFVMLAAVNPPSSLTKHPMAPATLSRGRLDAVILLVCAVGAGAIRAALLPVDERVARIRISRKVKRRIVQGVAAGVAVLALGAVASGALSHLATNASSSFSSGPVSNGGAARLFSASSDGRTPLWQAALKTFQASPLKGTGAGTFVIDWDRVRKGPMDVQNAHSLYLEMLAELGAVGELLLAVALIAVLVGLGRLARGSEKALYAALFGAALAWVLAAAVDWDWQMPAVTMWFFALGGVGLASPVGARLRLPRLRRWAVVPAVVACAALVLAPLKVVEAQGHLNRAVNAADRGNCAVAAPAATAGERVLSSLPESAIVLAYCAYQARHPAWAVAPLQQALSQDPRNWELWYDLAVIRVAMNRSARTAILTANQLNPLDPDVKAGMAVLEAPTVRQQQALVRVWGRTLSRQNALSALTGRTPAQNRQLQALERATSRDSEEVTAMRYTRDRALASLVPATP